jgi:hypothetical protein
MRLLSHLCFESRMDIAVTGLNGRQSVQRGGAEFTEFSLAAEAQRGHAALPYKKSQKSVIPALRQAQDRLAFGQAGIQVLVNI